MRRSILTFLGLVSFAIITNAQLFDDFSDGDFTNNPAWFGQTGKFMVNGSQQLQLNNASITDVAYLTTQALLADTATWEFYLKLGFDPSNNNNVQVYLMSDQADLSGPLNGYYLRIGENGSADGLDLYEQTGTSTTRIIDGTDAIGAISPEMRVRVTRTKAGQWSIWADTSLGPSPNYQLQGTGSSNAHNLGWIFGVFCRHTSSNSTKFYFDDFQVGPIYVDTFPPEISNVTVQDPQTILVAFNEPVDKATAETLSNYTLSGTLGAPVTATRQNDSTKVQLEWSGSLQNGQTYQLSISGVQDINGNTMVPTQVPVLYYEPEEGDVLITEIMADPNPTVGLPDVEYAELYNNTTVDIDLSNWEFSDGTTNATLPGQMLPANSFLILCDQADVSDLQPFGTVLGLSSWPSLNNTGDQLTLKDPNGLLIHSVDYNTDWYGDPDKESGGWSLEMVDPDGECLGRLNWSASEDVKGGTPGQANSRWLQKPDTTGPKLKTVLIQSPTQLLITFDRSVDLALGTQPGNYAITPTLGAPTTVSTVGTTKDQFQLNLSAPIQSGQLYTLTATGVADCRGYSATGGTSIEFIDPDSIVAGDVIINEVLFNPKSGGSDFVELYNNSDKVIDLQELTLLEADPVTGVVVDDVHVASEQRLLKPGAFFVLTVDRDNILSTYYTPNPDAIVEVKGTPNYPDDAGTVILWVDSNRVIDQLTYSADWHFALLDDVNGVSLERLFYDRPTQDANNWFSAASEVGYATPGYKNSQAGQENPFEGMVTVEPEVFSPDGDGYNDQLLIRYQIEEPGYVANIQIMDNQGRLVKMLAQNELLGREGVFTWDGIRENGRKAEVGIYIVYVELYNLNGQVKRYKLKAVVGGRL